jgi:hypothetical protein
MYGKVFEQIYDGSLRLNWKALVTFQQMIVLCNEDGTIDMTPQALHFRTGIPLEIIQEGIKILEQDDPESRTALENGKRIIRIDDHRTWGWTLVNHKYYKELASWEEKKKADRDRLREKRAGKTVKCRKVSQPVADVAHTDTHTNTDTNTIKKNTQKKTACVWPKDFILTDEMKIYAINKGINPEKVDAFFDDFRNWADQNEKTYKDWKAAYRTRIGKAPEYGKQFMGENQSQHDELVEVGNKWLTKNG